MKKFEELEIHGVDMEPIVGGRLGDWLRQLMQNQNEIIDFLKEMFPREMRREPENGK